VSFRLSFLTLVCLPAALSAQLPGKQQDTTSAPGDTLTRTPAAVQSITVTASSTPRQTPVNVIRITPQVISTTAATSTNSWDLLRQVAGVEVHEQGQGPGFASDASIRGFSSDHSTDIALWIDGVPINEPVNGHAEGYNDWSLLMPQAVSSMEVIEGPTSALYGNFAMAGVVNVQERERMSGQQFTLTGGAYGRVDGSYFTGLDKTNTGLVVGIRGMRDGGWRPNSEQHLGQFYGRLVQQLTPSVALDLGTQLYAAGWDSPGFLTVDQYDNNDFHNVSNTTDGGYKRHGIERASLRVLYGGSTIWRTTVYGEEGAWNFYLTIPPEPGSGEGSGGQTQEIDHRTDYGATSALTWIGSRTQVTMGVEGRLDYSDYQRWFTTNRVEGTPDALIDARQVSGAAFLQSTEDVGQHLRFTVGGRYDALDTRDNPVGDTVARASHGIFSPKLGALVHVPRIGDVYANVSRGFRSTDGVIEDPTLPFITEWNYESGLHAVVRRINVSAAFYRIDVSNEQTFDPILLTTTNGGRSRRQGVELTLGAALGPMARFSGRWTFTHARYLDLQTPDGDNLADTPVANTAKYVGDVALDLGRLSAPWAVRLTSNVLGPYTPFDEPGVELPAYALFNVSGRLLVGGNATLRLGVRNLFDKTYPELRAGGFISPGQPRAVYGGIDYTM
jgi:outer membrane receptor protein involved in Fe transport